MADIEHSGQVQGCAVGRAEAESEAAQDAYQCESGPVETYDFNVFHSRLDIRVLD